MKKILIIIALFLFLSCCSSKHIFTKYNNLIDEYYNVCEDLCRDILRDPNYFKTLARNLDPNKKGIYNEYN